MAQQTVNLGAAANDRTGDSLRSGGDKINQNFNELYARMAAVEVAAGSSATALAANTAADAANFATLSGQVSAEVTARAAALAAETAARNTALAAEAAARAAADLQPFIPTTNGMTLTVAQSYSVGAGHTITFPSLAANQWVRLEPANGDWYSLGANFDSPLPIGAVSGVEPDAALLLISNGTNIRIRQ